MSEQQAALDTLGPLDCAIIGGGMSGLYTGWRLRQDKGDWSVAIFEQSNRTGGRLLTWLPYGKDAGLRAELGGMRFIREQELVWNLIEHLDLQRAPFYVTGHNLLWYLRGQRMAAGDANAAAGRYYLEQGERGRQPADLIQHFINLVLGTPENQEVIRKYLGGGQPTSRQDWDLIKPELTYKGRRLWDLGFWNILSDTLSYEGYQYVSDAFGYYSLTSNWNAAEAMQNVYLDFTSNPTYETLSEGYGRLPDALRQEFEANGGHV
ncbi:MAG: FAD-dependent oxidoreductase, partial [Chloroflexi bacterium]|nr:FAD-dependent oxidoreductase [Chloroflexota bacterium]